MEIRCEKCGKLLFLIERVAELMAVISIKCTRKSCGKLNVITGRLSELPNVNQRSSS